ncbi:hypothetical protein BD324DRAFT_123266 [Kockovaella imperatae]|uniref:BTB domain-containing protein n=1 Tax=Kockovaella imperatae TaxID=4999 RepID=A0A1Y1UAU3_9TREE|nr:hypothetical protein BD324DRAFT_123266 [Kockovaella imperatae]ORX34626.1 hypothetical protein BD324DRAFT_123266 [Kockovaella imperatae]
MPKALTSKTTAPAAVAASDPLDWDPNKTHPKYDDEDANCALISSDGLMFLVDKEYLYSSSAVFRSMLKDGLAEEKQIMGRNRSIIRLVDEDFEDYRTLSYYLDIVHGTLKERLGFAPFPGCSNLRTSTTSTPWSDHPFIGHSGISRKETLRRRSHWPVNGISDPSSSSSSESMVSGDRQAKVRRPSTTCLVWSTRLLIPKRRR